MPFETLEMSKSISHDVNNSFKQVYAGEKWDSPAHQEDTEFRVTFGDNLPDGVVKDSTKAKYIVRGEKSIDKGYATSPLVFRVVFEDLSLIQQLRFVEYFHGKRPLAQPPVKPEAARSTTGVLYEPSISDFKSTKATASEGLDLPIWVLDYLIAEGYLETAMYVIKLPGVPYQSEEDKMNTPDLNETLFELYKARKKEPSQRFENYAKEWGSRELEKAAYLKLKECEQKALKIVTGADEVVTKDNLSEKPKTNTMKTGDLVS